MVPWAADIMEERQPAEDEIARLDSPLQCTQQRLGLAKTHLVLDSHMQSRPVLVLTCQHAGEMFRDAVPDPQDTVAGQLEGGTTAERHQPFKARFHGFALRGDRLAEIAQFVLAALRNGMEERDMSFEIVALGREMFVPQRCRPCMQITGKLSGQDQRFAGNAALSLSIIPFRRVRGAGDTIPTRLHCAR